MTLTEGPATFSGSEELITRAECEAAVKPGTTLNLAFSVTGRSIAITDQGDVALNGTYDPESGSFVASRPLDPPASGTTGTHTLTGTIDRSGRLTGALAITVTPPTAVCSIPVTGKKA